jgi:hypothetical protein
MSRWIVSLWWVESHGASDRLPARHLIDSLNTGQRSQDSVVTFTLGDLVDLTYGHTSAAHDVSLKTVLDMGRKLDAILPADKDVYMVAIEAQHVYDFKEALSPVIAAAVPVAVQ